MPLYFAKHPGSGHAWFDVGSRSVAERLESA